MNMTKPGNDKAMRAFWLSLAARWTKVPGFTWQVGMRDRLGDVVESVTDTQINWRNSFGLRAASLRSARLYHPDLEHMPSVAVLAAQVYRAEGTAHITHDEASREYRSWDCFGREVSSRYYAEVLVELLEAQQRKAQK